MARYSRFTLLCDLDERRAIADLAARLQRSQSDAVRFVVIEAVKQLAEVNTDSKLSMLTQEVKKEGANVSG